MNNLPTPKVPQKPLVDYDRFHHQMQHAEIDDALAVVSHGIKVIERSAIQIGLGLLTLKARFSRQGGGYKKKSGYSSGAQLNESDSLSSNPSFLEKLNQVGICPRTAQNYMLLAQKFGEHADKNLPINNIGITKLLIVAKDLSEDEISNLADGKKVRGMGWEDIAETSAKQLKLNFAESLTAAEIELKKVKNNNQKLQRENRNLTSQINAINNNISPVPALIVEGCLKIRADIEQMGQHFRDIAAAGEISPEAMFNITREAQSIANFVNRHWARELKDIKNNYKQSKQSGENQNG